MVFRLNWKMCLLLRADIVAEVLAAGSAFCHPCAGAQNHVVHGGELVCCIICRERGAGWHNWLFAGIGSYVRQAACERNVGALLAALACMLVIIVVFDQILFRPLSAWAVRFQPGKVGEPHLAEPWFLKLLRRTHLFRLCVLFCVNAARRFSRLP